MSPKPFVIKPLIAKRRSMSWERKSLFLPPATTISASHCRLAARERGRRHTVMILGRVLLCERWADSVHVWRRKFDVRRGHVRPHSGLYCALIQLRAGRRRIDRNNGATKSRYRDVPSVGSRDPPGSAGCRESDSGVWGVRRQDSSLEAGGRRGRRPRLLGAAKARPAMDEPRHSVGQPPPSPSFLAGLKRRAGCCPCYAWRF